MDNHEELFLNLFGDIDASENFPSKSPLLSHYSSLTVLESFVSNEEIWLSNPLFMNDFFEVRFGINNGMNRCIVSEYLRDRLDSEGRLEIFINHLQECFERYEAGAAFDTYVFCFAEHDEGDTDGLLSMWRGYGGDGKGAAVVFDTSKIKDSGNQSLLLSKVEYLTEAKMIDRLDWYIKIISDYAANNAIPDDKLYILAFYYFERLRHFSVFTKHTGFKEEREWRLVYLRDKDDDSLLKSMISYHNGPRGIEPKLKFKIAPVIGMTDDDLSLDRLIHAIILGPSHASELSKRSVHRMLEILDKSEWIERVYASEIPYRPN